jgi:hypothetical protein
MGAGYAGYEVVLGPAALRVVMVLRGADRVELANTLRTELCEGPNAAREIQLRFDADEIFEPGVPGGVYTVTPLSFNGYSAIHRPMGQHELMRLRQERSRAVNGRGCYVIDILPAESAFRRPRMFKPREIG